tara:strand:+ start:451 stop:693 length:243 start_codon:yes stop_codon:yes gene_type:complete
MKHIPNNEQDEARVDTMVRKMQEVFQTGKPVIDHNDLVLRGRDAVNTVGQMRVVRAAPHLFSQAMERFADDLLPLARFKK